MAINDLIELNLGRYILFCCRLNNITGIFPIFKPFKDAVKAFMIVCKKLLLLTLFLMFYTAIYTQNVGWMIGTWKGTNGTIQVSDVSGQMFTGTKTTEAGNSKIIISISGAFRGRGFYIEDGEVLHREGLENNPGHDCSGCTPVNKMAIRNDSLVIIYSISDCDERCDGETSFYRLLSEYDSTTQRYLVDRFGRPSDIIGFKPRREAELVASNDGDTGAIQKEVAAAIVPDTHVQQANDSLNSLKKIKQQQANDSILIVQQKKRQQEIADSLNLVQQKEQQRIKDSLDNVAKLKQQHINDSIQLALQQKRRQAITDSLNLAQQMAQQRITDSLDNVAKLKQQHIKDSIQLALQQQRQQEITDSLNLVQQKEQQRIKDSLDNVARLEQIRKRTEDSLRAVMATRQQWEADSLAAVRKKQYDDSVQQAALAKGVAPQTSDSAQSANGALTSRNSVLLGSYHITSPDILIELFDNAEIDGDRVSVYHNDTLIVSNQMLDKKPITLNIHADAANREHDFVLVAENLGTIPPNSALMRVTAGKQSYKLSVKTDMKTNARIVFYYDGK